MKIFWHDALWKILHRKLIRAGCMIEGTEIVRWLSGFSVRTGTGRSGAAEALSPALADGPSRRLQPPMMARPDPMRGPGSPPASSVMATVPRPGPGPGQGRRGAAMGIKVDAAGMLGLPAGLGSTLVWVGLRCCSGERRRRRGRASRQAQTEITAHNFKTKT